MRWSETRPPAPPPGTPSARKLRAGGGAHDKENRNRDPIVGRRNADVRNPGIAGRPGWARISIGGYLRKDGWAGPDAPPDGREVRGTEILVKRGIRQLLGQRQLVQEAIKTQWRNRHPCFLGGTRSTRSASATAATGGDVRARACPATCLPLIEDHGGSTKHGAVKTDHIPVHRLRRVFILQRPFGPAAGNCRAGWRSAVNCPH